jgi:SAM-dependent methyltransferase
VEPDAIRRLVEAGYDELAERFQSPFVENFENKPLDCELLERFADLCAEGPVCDVGCGTGPVAAYLHRRGLEASGVDLSEVTIARARVLSPDLEFTVMNLLELSFPDGNLGGLTAFYSIIHLTRAQVPDAFAEFRRVLRPGGHLLLSCYAGEGERFLEPGEGYAVRMFSTFFSTEELTAGLESAGFEVVDVREREPYQYEIDLPRIYVLAQRP